MPDNTKQVSISCDASKFAAGAVLKQQDINGDWKPCGYISKTFSPAKQNYPIYDREMLAIVEVLKDWRSFLEGLPEPFEIVTDHSNLTFWQTTQDLSRRQARWALYLSCFNFTLVHKPGKLNTQADALS